jgi:hypothetical protein
MIENKKNNYHNSHQHKWWLNSHLVFFSKELYSDDIIDDIKMKHEEECIAITCIQ